MPNSKNKELEEFLYVISHDLNSPLRHIKEFTNLLLENLRDGRLNEREELYAGFISKSVEQVQDMVKKLLEYSRLNTRELKFEKFNAKNLIEKICEANNEEGNTEFTINCTANIYFSADKELIVTLINELINNAKKFNLSDIIKISIEVTEIDSDIQFKISDNGIGNISEQNKEGVFKVFGQLNPKEEFEGTGMGLTICKKITELHDGSIWVEDVTDNGTTFAFKINNQYQ